MSSNLKISPYNFVLNDRFLLCLACGLMFLKRLILLKYGYNYEEGKELECILNILEGQLVFRDFWWQYGPGPIYFIALLAKLFDGPSFLLGRATVTLGAVAMTFYAFRIARLFLPSSWAFWTALMASSGLAFREGTYGHIFAYLGMIGSWYYLLVYFKKEFLDSHLVKSGLFVFMALISKPMIFGLCSIFAVLICMGFWIYSHSLNRLPLKSIAVFLGFSFVPGFLTYGYLFSLISIELFWAQIFPASSGSFFLSDFYLKSLLPPFPGDSFQVWKNQMNGYLVDDLRWWTIVLTLMGCLIYLIREALKRPRKLNKLFPMFSLLVYGFLIESETLILVERPITFFINMLPNYILLAYGFMWIKEKTQKSFMVYVFSGLFCLFYFFYSPMRLGLYYFGNAQALGLPYAETVRTPEYTANAYRNIAAFIQVHSKPHEPILFAGYDNFIYLASERKPLFPEDFAAFTRVSFHPYHSIGQKYPIEFYEGVENKIVGRVKSDLPVLIVIPADFLKQDNRKSSPFLKYLLKHWRVAGEINADLQQGPFDFADLHMKAFVLKTNSS